MNFLKSFLLSSPGLHFVGNLLFHFFLCSLLFLELSFCKVFAVCAFSVLFIDTLADGAVDVVLGFTWFIYWVFSS